METKTEQEKVTLQTKKKKEQGSKGKQATVAHQKQETKEGLPAENGELREESPAPDEAGEKGATAAGRYTPSLRGPCLTSWEMRRNSYQLFCKHRVKKKKAVLETFLRRESHHIQSFKGQFFFFFLSGESSAVAYFSIQPEIAEYWMPDTLTVLGASSTCHGGGSFSFPIIYSILNDNLGAPGVHLICL